MQVVTKAFWPLFGFGYCTLMLGLWMDNRYVGAIGYAAAGFAAFVLGPQLLLRKLSRTR